MIRHILTALTCLSLTACSLDIKNEQEISGDDIINTTQKATSILAQAYRDLPYAPETLTMLSEDLQPTYLIEYNSDTKKYYAWDERTLRTSTSSVWDSYYSAITHLNAILNTEQNIKDKGAEWYYIKGNALALKAQIYFDLLQLYSPRYSPENLGVVRKDIVKLENNKRLTQGESIQYIQTMLTEGIKLMTGYNSAKVYFITLASAQQLEAKIALYVRDYPKAEQLAQTLVSLSPTLPNTPESYRALWKYTDNTPSQQIYWVYDYRGNPNYYLETGKTGDIMQVNYLNEFKSTDMRYTVSQYKYEMKGEGATTSARSLLGKYKMNFNDKEERRIVLSRNTESHFILLESLIEQQKLDEATALLNEFLVSVNNEPIESVHSQQVLRLLFRAEKQKEFIGERINYFDLKRWNVDITRYISDSNKKLSTVEASDFRWTWAIPYTEIKYNPNVKQNEGWQNID
ncbi:RagB/SusD family nutrient uptake outer membrane protein [Myroides sp. N17-2]|uniref:RagB/SusD family nutrient uptake outer membrane protein n=1 Tax=Myroides sp. N17-2 TaxID=2030799 RepID=UPI000EFBCAA4|nr:RagB/SusD family nutrient uptake outer membrane protein [Myroides sp. N17-2]